MKKIKKSYNEIWNERKRTIGSLLLLVVVVMFAVSGVRYLLNYIDFQNIKEIISAPAEEHKYPNLYNASRYFFRIYYPDGWMAEGGANGFFIDESTGLAAELYPLVFEDAATPGSDAEPGATAAVSYEKVRDKNLTVFYYYKNYTDGMLQAGLAEEGPGTDGTPEPVEPDASAAAETGVQPAEDGKTVTPAAASAYQGIENKVMLGIAAEAVYEQYKISYPSAEFTEIEDTKTDLYPLKRFTFSYTDESLVAHKTDVYVAARSMNYIVIEYSASSSGPGLRAKSYDEYRTAFLDILNEFRLSVFED